jgi:protein-S-isoprenylcysteine O-methyltransferase Ste14
VKKIPLVSAVAVLGVAALFALTWALPLKRGLEGSREGAGPLRSELSISWVVLAPQSELQFRSALARIGTGLAFTSNRALRLAIVYAHYRFESHSSDFIWEIGALVVALLGLGFRFYTVGITAGHGRRSAANRLVTTGPYALVRHPLASANLVIAMGLSLFPHGWVLPVVAMVIAVTYYRGKIRRDDDTLRAQFGADFERWAAKVPALLPRLSGYVSPERRFEWGRIPRREYSIGAIILLVPIVLDVVEDFADTLTLVIDPVWSIVAVAGIALLTGIEVTDLRATNPSGLVGRLRTRYTEFHESKTLAARILTDIERLLEGMTSRRCLDHIEHHIHALRDVARAGQPATAVHVLQIPARIDNFGVDLSHVGRSGLLGHLAAPVAALHMRFEALKEMQALQERQKRHLEDASTTLDPDSLIVVYRQILEFTQQTVTQAQALAPQLRAFAGRRGWGILG